jgi:hypothetical protein
MKFFRRQQRLKGNAPTTRRQACSHAWRHRVTPRLEPLEDRRLLATLLGLTATNSLIRFDSATPGTIQSTTAITGLQT